MELKQSFKHDLPYSLNENMVCPSCTTRHWKVISNESVQLIKEPVFLVVKTNKTTNQKFLGCPNFPNCKHSDDIFSVRKEKADRKIFEIEDELRPY